MASSSSSSSSSTLFLSACVSSCFFMLLISSPALAFNITKILEDYPDFDTFNSLLSQSKLAAEINSRSTITVLAVDNGAAGGLSGKPEDELKRILSVHVVLDYYDEKKLNNLKKKSTLLTTLFQSSGVAVNEQGFLNVTKDAKSGEVRVGSAVPGAGLTATFVKEVATQPFNISVLQVSGVIYPTGIDHVNSTAPSAAPPTKSPAPAAAPKGSSSAETPEASAPSSEASEAPAPGADAPTDDSDAPAPADAPSSAADGAPSSAADGAPAGSSDAPGSDASSPGPSSDDSADSSASRAAVTLLAVVAGVISMVVAHY